MIPSYLPVAEAVVVAVAPEATGAQDLMLILA